jgi:hypothetical protein
MATPVNNTILFNGSGSNTTSASALNLGSPLLIEHDRATNVTNIDQNTIRISFEGNATIMLPSGNITVPDRGNAIVVSMHGLMTTSGHVTYMDTNGQGNGTVTFTEYRPNNANTAIGTAYIQTNSSTGQQLAALNNTIGVFKDQAISQTETLVTFWKWQ